MLSTLLLFSLESVLPFEVWKPILSTSFIISIALLFLLSGRSLPILSTRPFLLVSGSLTLLFGVDAYAQLAKWEGMHDAGMKGSERVGEYTLNERRFRAQRNFYLSFFSLVLHLAFYLAQKLILKYETLNAKLTKASSTLYKKQIEEDRRQASELDAKDE